MLEDLADEDGTGQRVSQSTSQPQGVRKNGVRTAFVFDGVWLQPPRHTQVIQGHAGGRKLRPRKKVFSEGMNRIQDGALGEDRPLPGPDSDYHGSSDSSDSDKDDDNEEEYTLLDNLQKKRKVGEVKTQPPVPSKRHKGDVKKSKSNGLLPDGFLLRKRAPRLRVPALLKESKSETEVPIKTRHSLYSSRLARNPTKTRPEMAPFLEDRRSTADNFTPTQSSLYTAQIHLCSTASQKNEHPETSCDLLDLLDFLYSAEVNAIFCRHHSMLLPLNAIATHLRRRHSHLHLDRPTQHDIVAHVGAWLGSDVCQSPEAIVLPETLPMPLKLSPKTVRYRFRCPECSQWITRNDSYSGCPETELYSHMNKIHNIPKRPKTVEGSWCQVIRVHTLKQGRSKDHLFRLLNYIPYDLPITPSFATKTYLASPNSTWFYKLKWPQHRASILAKVPFERIQCLILPPSKQLVFGQSSERNRYIEKGLLHVRAKLTAYLRNGQHFISSLHGAYEGCFKTRDEKHLAFFRLINNENIPSYRGPLMKVVAMLVRLAALVGSKEDADKQIVKALFLGHDDQLSESRRLCDLLVAMKGKDPAGNNYLSRALHRLLQSLLCPKSLNDQDIACPTELFIFLASLTDKVAEYRTAASVKNNCCKLQFGFRMIYVHIVRMEAYQISNYAPFEKKESFVLAMHSTQQDNDHTKAELHINGKPPDGTAFGQEIRDDEDDDEDDDDDDDDDDDQDDQDDEDNSEEVVDSDELLQIILSKANVFGLAQLAASVEQNTVLLSNAFEKYRMYIMQEQKLDFISPFGRNTRIWMVAAVGAKNEPVGAQLNVAIMDGTIKVSHAGDATSLPKTITLRCWAKAAQKSIVEFQDSVEQLLPDGIRTSTFPLEKISDNLLSSDAPHKQGANANSLGAWTAMVRAVLFKPGEARHGIFSSHGISSLAARRWFNMEQTSVLPCLAKVLALACGIGLQEFKYGQICFNPEAHSNRNVWMLKNGLIAINDPVKNLGRNSTSTRLFAFPREVTKHLALYLYAIRPIAVELLVHLGQDVPYYSSNIWAHIQRPRPHEGRNPWIWSGSRVSASIQVATNKWLGVVLTPTLIQRIESQLFSKHLPALFVADEQSPVDQQAQHVSYTSLSHYGWVSHFPPIKHLRLHQPIRHLALSEIWHALLHLGPVNDSWRKTVAESPLTATLNRLDVARRVARHLVPGQYKIRSAEDAHSFLQSLPFVYSSQADASTLGDSVLQKVTSSLCRNAVQKRPTLDDVADAAVIIIQELERWSFAGLANSWVMDSGDLLMYEDLRMELLAKYRKLKSENEQTWVMFCTNVSNLHHSGTESSPALT